MTSLLVYLALQATVTLEPQLGKLCVGGAAAPMSIERCETVEGTAFAIEASDEPAVFAWLRRDGRVLVLGTIAAGATEVRLPEEPAMIDLRLVGSQQRDWPQRTTLVAGPSGAPDRWRIVLSEMEVDNLRQIHVPRGLRELRIEAERHAPYTVSRERLEDLPVTLGVIRLDPVPQIRGLAIDRDGEPLAAVLALSLDDALLATTDGSGEILYEVACADSGTCLLPEWFRLEHPGSAPRWFRVLNRRRDVNLGAVQMTPGGTLELRVDRSRVGGPLEVEIVEDRTPAGSSDADPVQGYAESIGFFESSPEDGADAPMDPSGSYPRIASASLPRSDSRITFEDLPPGQLRVSVRGRRPGELLSRYFSVEPGSSTEIAMVIEPTVVLFEVVDGGEAVGGVPVVVEQLVRPFQTVQTMPTDRDGRTQVELWEKSPSLARVAHRQSRGVSYFEPGADAETEVPIDVIRGELRGRVEDFETGEAIQGARVVCQSVPYRDEDAFRATTGEEGEFAISPILPDQYRLTVSARGYAEQDGMFVIDPRDPSPVTIRMERGLDYTIRLVWDDGEPITDALYIEEDPFGFQARADEQGVVRIRRVPLDRAVRFWVIPSAGSLGVGSRGWETDLEVEVRRPGRNLTVWFEDEDRRPVDFGHMNLAWDHFPVPRRVRVAMEQAQGRSFWSGPSSRIVLEGMAPGHYTLWAIRDESHLQHLPPEPSRHVTRVHFSGAEQSARVVVRNDPRRREDERGH